MNNINIFYEFYVNKMIDEKNNNIGEIYTKNESIYIKKHLT